MRGSVSLADDEFGSICQQAFQKWACLQRQTIGEARFPGHAFLVSSLAQGHPTLPRALELEIDSEGVFAVGNTSWSSIEACCPSRLESFRQPLQVRVATKTLTCLKFARNNADELLRGSPFEKDDNYLPVLMLAWTYILSAHWAETMPTRCSIAYTQAQSTIVDFSEPYHADQNNIQILLEHADASEIRWWAAILAPGQGWAARMCCPHKTYMSPWSIEHRADCDFVVRHPAGAIPSFCPAASSYDAIGYLDKFCTDHGIIDQSHAALAAVISLPSMGTGRTLNLRSASIATLGHLYSSTKPKHCASRNIRHDWAYKDQHLDRLLTLSCNIKGMRPMLLSAFYEPSIECNAVAAWLQGTFAAIDLLVGSDPYITVRLCMERAPKASFLWLGIYALGRHASLIQEARFGQIPIDLHSAAWSGTLQSFIQQRLSVPLVTDGFVSRADECRLLFLAQAGSHARVPLCQWQPFGATPLEETDLEIRIHQACGGHQLRYEGVIWRCEGNKEKFQPSSARTTGLTHTSVSQDPACDNVDSTPVYSTDSNRNREAISENATRMIFGWLRCDGRAPHEADIWKHEWFEVSDSEDDETNGTESAISELRGSPAQVTSWLSCIRTGMEEFDRDFALDD
ncbi:hypothetical protein CERZMDRAFT_115540 [Cercospora zeae-maydis SCOH1-5]|uniref:Uncharacterized protein n=1 Tax=Cercospora zeae-maydis SCOH1-5 TaxID=717836 RepID=A0A6A6F0U6_9PEZI|nr:hypothetical protein CERZMDRAFT_115540 [Cercospora zeae-maydis SCOH1-5]